MTDSGQTASSIEMHGSLRTLDRGDSPPTKVVPQVRLVQPGSWCPCTRCHRAIQFVPGGKRTLVALATYADEALQSVELFHAECYDAANSTPS